MTWWFASDIVVSPGDSQQSEVRHEFLARLASLLSPELRQVSAAPTFDSLPGYPSVAATTVELSNNVVLQNYDYALASPPPLGADGETKAAWHRLQAVALVNVGRWQESLDLLDIAATETTDSVHQAMIHYLRSLVLQKRFSDPKAGLRALDDAERCLGQPITANERVEAAWCRNGRALAEVLQWRRDPEQGCIDQAVDLVSEAFWLVNGLEEPAAVYLRNNLLANMAFLFEMSGNFDEAIDLFTSMFATQEELLSWDSSPYKTTLCYRVAVIATHAGRYAEACKLLDAAADSAEQLNSSFALERILRATAFHAAASGNYLAAQSACERGLEIATELWSTVGVEAHRAAQARISARQLPAKPTPKLPAYFPEFDLEDVPPVRLNDFLVGAQS